jgi:uncharacterized phage-associated protein
MAKINKEKYKNAILFFAASVSCLGRVKLNKLLYFADFDHFEKYGESITGETYQNDKLGPVPMHIEETIEEMESAKEADIVAEAVIDFVRYHLVPRIHYNPSIFKPSEMEILSAVSEKWGHHTAKELVIASHGEAPWLATRNGNIIPYALAYYRGKFEEPSYDEEMRQDTTLAGCTQDSSI